MFYFSASRAEWFWCVGVIPARSFALDVGQNINWRNYLATKKTCHDCAEVNSGIIRTVSVMILLQQDELSCFSTATDMTRLIIAY
jgi:hypothetical protein